MPKKTKTLPEKEIWKYIAEVGSLMFMQRLHHRLLVNTFDTVASHAYHTGLIAYCLSRMEGLSHDEGLKALAMGVLHDNAEARTGDLDLPAKPYTQNDEEKAISDQLKNLPFGEDLKKVFEEYEQRETLLSKCVKDADALEQVYQTWILTYMGNKMAEKWFKDDFSNRIPYLRTKSAKKLALQTKNTHPHEWWYEDMITPGVKNTHLNGKK